MTTSDDLIVFLRARLDEEERVALAACGRDGEPGQPEHWHWECTEDDTPVDIDLAIAGGEEFLEHGEHFRVGLRSVEKHPAGSFGPLPHLVLGDEEVRPQDARHIARHDPARVLREVEADRKLIDLYGRSKSYRHGTRVLGMPHSRAEHARNTAGLTKRRRERSWR